MPSAINESQFEKMMAESRLDELSMQKTVIGQSKMQAGPTISHISDVQSINEVNKLYNQNELEMDKYVKKMHKKAKKVGDLNSTKASQSKNTNQYSSSKYGFEKSLRNYNNVIELTEMSRKNLMEFLDSLEADKPLLDIGAGSDEDDEDCRDVIHEVQEKEGDDREVDLKVNMAKAQFTGLIRSRQPSSFNKASRSGSALKMGDQVDLIKKFSM